MKAGTFTGAPGLDSARLEAAERSLTNGTRVELHQQGTHVVGVHASYIDTDLTATIDAQKAFDGLLPAPAGVLLFRAEGELRLMAGVSPAG
jgi:NAD(P)-dependent dehydrogenase (short-subunit alcohol dehydrogenase family)